MYKITYKKTTPGATWAVTKEFYLYDAKHLTSTLMALKHRLTPAEYRTLKTEEVKGGQK